MNFKLMNVGLNLHILKHNKKSSENIKKCAFKLIYFLKCAVGPMK